MKFRTDFSFFLYLLILYKIINIHCIISARELHPDSNPHAKDEDFVELQTAYEELLERHKNHTGKPRQVLNHTFRHDLIYNIIYIFNH